MKLGVLGGTFDPIHVGHLIIAQEAAVEAGLDRVLFVPAGQPWLKAGSPVSPGQRRLEMVRRAVSGNYRYAVSAVEIERPGPTYTVDTLEALREGEGAGHSLHFIMGMDSLENLHRWSRPERLFDLCKLLAVSRPGHQDFDMTTLDAIRPGASRMVAVVHGPRHRHKRRGGAQARVPRAAHHPLGARPGGGVHLRAWTVSGGRE